MRTLAATVAAADSGSLDVDEGTEQAQTAAPTLVAAVPSLKSLCEDSLCAQVDHRGAVSCFEFALSLLCPRLTEFCASFVLLNADLLLEQALTTLSLRSLAQLEHYLHAWHPSLYKLEKPAGFHDTFARTAFLLGSGFDDASDDEETEQRDASAATSSAASSAPVELKRSAPIVSAADVLGVLESKGGAPGSLFELVQEPTGLRLRVPAAATSSPGLSGKQSPSVHLFSRVRALRKKLSQIAALQQAQSEVSPVCARWFLSRVIS